MSEHLGFRLPRICLPRAGVDLAKWAVIACDQHTAQPEYWQQVEREVGDAPSSLRLIVPEAHLGAADMPQRIARIQHTMRRYLADGVLQEREGAVYVERRVDGRVRRGLMLELDLEHYDFDAASTSLIRPTEGTIVARLAPRIEVRSGAALELPHILVLIDDPEGTVIEPLAAQRASLQPLYDTELMLGGGRVAGYAVDAALGEAAAHALHALGQAPAFARRYGVPLGTPPMLFAMGDGNHSLATAKLIWERHKATVGMHHPSRFALVEVVNIHDAALDFAPIHRLLFGVTADLRQALAAHFGGRLRCTDMPSAAAMRERVSAAPPGMLAVGVIGPGALCSVIDIADPPSSLAVGALQPVLDAFVAAGHARELDYVHGDEVLQRLSAAQGNVGLHFAPVGKSELLKRVILDGPLPRKTFSMGEAHEKRYYVEARRLQPPAPG